jgi:hypothetical protein
LNAKFNFRFELPLENKIVDRNLSNEYETSWMYNIFLRRISMVCRQWPCLISALVQIYYGFWFSLISENEFHEALRTKVHIWVLFWIKNELLIFFENFVNCFWKIFSLLIKFCQISSSKYLKTLAFCLVLHSFTSKRHRNKYQRENFIIPEL